MGWGGVASAKQMSVSSQCRPGEALYFTGAERAALALTEAVTRLCEAPERPSHAANAADLEGWSATNS